MMLNIAHFVPSYCHLKQVVFFLIFSSSIYSQTFELLNTQDLKSGYSGFSAFTDYTGDGYLDIFVTGVDFRNRYDNRTAVFYENNGDNSFTESSINNIPRVIYGDYDWVDYDNNGTLDLLYSGTTSGGSDYGIAKIFKNVNKGCQFIELPMDLPGITRGASRWVDIDNDGLLDIFLAGINENDNFDIFFFKNNGDDTFSEISNTSISELTGGRSNGGYTSARWSDFDGDGLKDVILAITTRTDYSLEIYKNLGGFLFEKQNTPIPRLSYVAMELGDMNNDNLVDIVLTGSNNVENFNVDGDSDLTVFINNGNMNFVNSFSIQNLGTFNNDIALSDIDNDGFLDILNYGTGPDDTYGDITKIYTNNANNTFSEISHTLPKCWSGGAVFGDIDNDNDNDILYFGRLSADHDEITYVYENTLINLELPTEILVKESCECNNTLTFTLNNSTDTLQWDFGDPTTGVQNNSIDKKASHNFSNTGSFIVSATYTKNGITNKITKQIILNGLPLIEQPNDLNACNNGESQTYDFNELKDSEILNGASLNEFELFYYNSYVNAENDQFRITMPYVNQNSGETIYVRVQSTTNSNCFLITDFNIVIEELPTFNTVNDLVLCDDDTDGFAIFDLTSTESQLIDNQNNVIVEYYDEQANIIPANLLNSYENSNAESETITARIVNVISTCYVETTFDILVRPIPRVNQSQVLIGCDENGDGISEAFDTSGITEMLIGNQSNLSFDFFDTNGNSLGNLTNPYTNSVPFEEIIVVRVSNNETNCFVETDLILRTSEKPDIYELNDLYACDEGNGYATFDTSSITTNLIGNQIGLSVSYFDSFGSIINDFNSTAFTNQFPFEQEIFVRVEDTGNVACFSETSFTLFVNSTPQINLEETYYLCDLEPSLLLSVPDNFDAYSWTYEDGTEISNSSEAILIQEGSYIFTLTEVTNGIQCQKSTIFELVRSELPQIQEVLFNELSNSNSLEIIAVGDGDFEYSIDGITYYENNVFNKVLGGTFTTYIRDKKGCGEDSFEVTLIDYPRFFTPNNDSKNDFWQILGADNYPNAIISIFDRYGKLLHSFNSFDIGWDGNHLGKPMPSNGYWFNVTLGNGRTFNGHFTLKR